eukprot:gnl/Dysnectes_brevis/4885_a6780_742.p1 GENE.gnl/Dysnectes_brevis/4885_a6780_742~~gnl/Dysnectes_brevis/4885_a6780_742.p1  ORF type:complete len:542 (+),score=75.74 gnl/Dysnectes_brevis/4885_a6780_742:78-1628(+)
MPPNPMFSFPHIDESKILDVLKELGVSFKLRKLTKESLTVDKIQQLWKLYFLEDFQAGYWLCKVCMYLDPRDDNPCQDPFGPNPRFSGKLENAILFLNYARQLNIPPSQLFEPRKFVTDHPGEVKQAVNTFYLMLTAVSPNIKQHSRPVTVPLATPSSIGVKTMPSSDESNVQEEEEEDLKDTEDSDADPSNADEHIASFLQPMEEEEQLMAELMEPQSTKKTPQKWSGDQTPEHTVDVDQHSPQALPVPVQDSGHSTALIAGLLALLSSCDDPAVTREISSQLHPLVTELGLSDEPLRAACKHSAAVSEMRAHNTQLTRQLSTLSDTLTAKQREAVQARQQVEAASSKIRDLLLALTTEQSRRATLEALSREARREAARLKLELATLDGAAGTPTRLAAKEAHRVELARELALLRGKLNDTTLELTRARTELTNYPLRPRAQQHPGRVLSMALADRDRLERLYEEVLADHRRSEGQVALLKRQLALKKGSGSPSSRLTPGKVSKRGVKPHGERKR